MTVHGNRPRCPAERASARGRGPLLVNGERKIEGPMLENLSMSQSWNGYIWQVQQSSPEGKHLPNGHNGLLHTYPVPGKRPGDFMHVRRDSLASKSRDSPVSMGSVDRPSSVDRLSSDRLSSDRLSNDRLSNDRLSNDRLSSGDRLSNSSDRNRFATSYDDDSLTTASSNLDSSEQEEEYVTLDRSYVFPKSFRGHNLSHHSSMIDLKHNSLYSPKVNNGDVYSSGTLPHNRKFRAPLRSVSVNETDLDAVDIDGKSIPWAKRSLKKIYENIGDILKPKPASPKSPVVDILPIQSDYVGVRNDLSDTSSVKTENNSESGKTPKNQGKLRKRSKSLGELQLFGEHNENELDSDSSSESDESDIDGDDFGFLPHGSVHSSTAMHKSKSASAHHSLLPKRWRSKPRNSTSGQCLWSPEVSR